MVHELSIAGKDLTSISAYERPRWLRDVLRFLPLKPQFVLSGNVRDLQLCELKVGSIATLPLFEVLGIELGQPASFK